MAVVFARISAVFGLCLSMKVAKHSPELLVLQHRPVWLPAFFGAACFFIGYKFVADFNEMTTWELVGACMAGLAFGLFTMLSSIRTTVSFDAQRGEVSWCHQGVFSGDEGRVELNAIQSVILERQPLSRGTGSYRVVLLTSNGAIPLTPHYSGVEPHEENATAIRDWLAARVAFV